MNKKGSLLIPGLAAGIAAGITTVVVINALNVPLSNAGNRSVRITGFDCSGYIRDAGALLFTPVDFFVTVACDNILNEKSIFEIPNPAYTTDYSGTFAAENSFKRFLSAVLDSTSTISISARASFPAATLNDQVICDFIIYYEYVD